ncbi:unnamed protein product [Plutella xylostella]|uniref:(diamondback moth) hypothetical protein n=1 Tax=Plutella xylostella TaxID=51655 RepID=A0A8S4E0N5_PLUXY|nr:unnamed protein product [Plutella xylostella]
MRMDITVQGVAIVVLANGQPNCGGMVLTARHVLSAAHCFINQNGAAISPSVFTVRVGSTYSMSGGSVHKVSTIVLHESYNNPTSNNDVAVVVLASRIRSFNSSTVRPAIVPPSGYVVPDNASVVAIGWGRTVVQRYNGAPTVSVNFLLLVSLVTSIILTNNTKM